MENKEEKGFDKLLTALELSVKLLDKAIELQKLKNSKPEWWQRNVPKYPLGGFISNDSKKEIEDYLNGDDEFVMNKSNLSKGLEFLDLADSFKQRIADITMKKEVDVPLKKLPFGDYPRAKNFPNDTRKICFVFVDTETRLYLDISTRDEFEKLRKEGTLIYWRWA